MNTAATIVAVWLSLNPAELTPRHDVREAFDFACEVLTYDCSEIEPPKVEWSDLYNLYGIFGGYSSGDTIHMDNTMLRYADRAFTNSVLAHEIVHYLDTQLGITNMGDKASICQSEARGWRVGNAYVIVHGRPDLADFGWFTRYGCFQ